MRLLPLPLLAALLGLACQRAPGPSPQYDEARTLWSSVLKERGLESAYVDPRADRVVSLLGQVDPKSLDSPFAQQLKAEIAAGQASAREAAAASERQEAEMREAAARAAAAMGTRQQEVPARAPEPSAAQAAPDAGAGDTQPREGMEAARFKQDFSRCFEYQNPSIVQGRAGGEVWALKDLTVCRELHAPLVGRSVLLMDGKVLAIRPSSDLAPKLFKVVDGKLVEARPGEQKAAAAAAPAEPPAGEAAPEAPDAGAAAP